MTTPATPKSKSASPEKQTAKPAKSPFVLGKGPGPIDNAKIKAKIEKWQAAGGGAVTVVEPPASGTDNDGATPKKKDAHKDEGNKKKAEPEKAEPDAAPAAGGEEVVKEKEAVKPVVKSPMPRSPAPTKKQLAIKPVKANDLDQDVQAAVTPKKRVISDSHWRKSRSPPKDPKPTGWVRPAVKKVAVPKPEEKEPEPKKSPPKIPILLPKPVFAPDGTRVAAVRRRRKSTVSKSSDEDDLTEPELEPRPRREDRSLPKEKAYEPPSSSARVKDAIKKHESLARADVFDDAPTKKKSVRKTKSSYGDEERKRAVSPSESTARGARSEDELRRRRKMRRRPTESRDDVSVVSPEDDRTAERRRSRRKTHRPTSPKLDDKPAAATQSAPVTPPPSTPKADANPETPADKVFDTRMAAWLSCTPDPFVEGKDDKEKQRRRSSRRSSSSTEGSTVLSEEKRGEKDPGKDSPPPRYGSTRRRKQRRSFDSQDDSMLSTDRRKSISSLAPSQDEENMITVEYDESSTTTLSAPPSLKRRSAKRASGSPTKNRPSPLPATIPEDEVASSIATSSVDPSMVDLPDVTPRARNSVRRGFPTTGRKLSTIVSMDSAGSERKPSRTTSQRSDNTIHPDDAIVDNEPADDSGKPADAMSIMTGMTGMTGRSRNSTKRRLASHSDLISVLSMGRKDSKSKSIVSARSIRTNKSRLATATIDDLMREVQTDEAKYMRELRTLVDGVIPVLLTCVLSKSESAVTAGLFSKTGTGGESTKITKPIVDMGVALERLKSLHKRIPKTEPEAFLSWAQSAQRVYGDYVRSWRLGFQDVVVNLAPASDDEKADDDQADAHSTIDEGMPRNEEGYVVDGDGERVDVAFLLKRPLVRLKYLSKTFKGISILKPSDRANDMAAKYQDLVIQARKKSNEERARLEDEAAASIDATRARDPRSLAPIAGVNVDATRCVRARDYFDMTLLHSSGQEVDCRVELLIRDDAPGRGSTGDLLLCEVDNTGRWLFFPPIQLNRISARNGDAKGEIVVMLRGFKSGGDEWRELLMLRTNDEDVGFEWVQMLGLIPVPHKPLSRGLSFRQKPVPPPKPGSIHDSSSFLSVDTGSTPPIKSRTPSPREIQVPIGERAGGSSRKWGQGTPEKSPPMSPETAPSSVLSSEFGTLGTNESSDVFSSEATGDEDLTPRKTRLPPLQVSSSTWTDAMARSESPTTPTLKRSKAKRYSRGDPRSSKGSRDSSLDQEPHSPEQLAPRPSLQSEASYATTSSSVTHSSYTSSSTERGSKVGYSVWYPPSEPEDVSDYSDEEDAPLPRRTLTKRPQAHRRTSSVPSAELPTIPKLRKASQPEIPTKNEILEHEMRAESLPIHTPSSASGRLQKKKPIMAEERPLPETGAEPPAPPPHRVVSPTPPKVAPVPNLSPPKPAYRQHRRTSSPLKHEYQPSTCSESSDDDSELSYSDYSGSSYSESSEDDLEADDVAPLGPLPPMDPERQFPEPSPPESLYAPATASLGPSQSASQAPYRAVPPSSDRATKMVANIFAWSDKGMWDLLHPDECSIVITPGLIEAYEMGPEHSIDAITEDEVNKRPLIGFELTPLVPLRRGTALDISIRSPPTANSRIRTTANIMFRSRSPEECEALYNLINKARINNPTYIALQNARGPHGQDTWAAAMDRQNAERTEGSAAGGSSWWGGLGRRNSYRAKSTRALSTSAGTGSSVNTIGSAFSALKRFSGNNKIFHHSSQDSRSRSTDSLSGEAESSTGTSPNQTPNADDPTLDPQGMPLGIMNSKIRLYSRESSQKWRDMGAARLSIMRPSRPSSPNANPYVRQGGQGSPGQRDPGAAKRIVVLGKTRGETLLDVTLDESCFERVARTGIAASVWEDTVGTNDEMGGVPAMGGVAGTKARVYMIQVSCCMALHCLAVANSYIADEIGARVRVLLLLAWEAAILELRRTAHSSFRSPRLLSLDGLQAFRSCKAGVSGFSRPQQHPSSQHSRCVGLEQSRHVLLRNTGVGTTATRIHERFFHDREELPFFYFP